MANPARNRQARDYHVTIPHGRELVFGNFRAQKSPDSCESGLSVEMPGIEPGSDVVFIRLLRAQSAWSFIDLSLLADEQLLGLVGFRSSSLPPTGATNSGYLNDARI